MAQAWPGSQSPTGELMNALPKVVFSSTLSRVEWSNARVSDRPVEEEIPELKGRARQGHRRLRRSELRPLARRPRPDRRVPDQRPAGRARRWPAAAARAGRATAARARQQHRLGRRAHHPDLHTALSRAQRGSTHGTRDLRHVDVARRVRHRPERQPREPVRRRRRDAARLDRSTRRPTRTAPSCRRCSTASARS